MTRRVAVLVASLLATPACSESTSNTPSTAASTVTSASITTSTTLAQTTTAASTTSAPTTSTTTTTEPPPTTEPPATRELVLGLGGIGGAEFGTDPEGVIDYVGSVLGAPTNDTGWVDPFTFALCEGTQVRKVEWGVLSLIFGDVSPFATGRRHFHGWEYGLAGELGGEPVGLHTAGGLTLGSSVAELRAEFPDVAVDPGEEGLIPSNFFVDDAFRGLLTAADDDGVVTVMFGGAGCGE